MAEIKTKYDEWKDANQQLDGPRPAVREDDDHALEMRTQLFRDYKRFLDQKHFAENFDSRSNLHSTVLEEFLFYLFRDLVDSFGPHALIGKSHAFKDLFFAPPSYEEMLERPYARVERKDHDFVIGATVTASFQVSPPLDDSSNVGEANELTVIEKLGDADDITEITVVEPLDYGTVGLVENSETLVFDVPAVAIECKTYLDKTMLEGSSRAAEEIKARNSNGLYILVCERLKLSGAVNLRKYAVDQVYVLRQERNIDREFRLEDGYVGNEISDDVVKHLFETVRRALVTDWSVGLEEGLSRGWLLE